MENLPKAKSANLIAAMQSKLESYKTAQQSFMSKLDKLHGRFKEGEFGDVTDKTLDWTTKSITKLRRERVDIYLINYAKLNLDNEATEIIGSYDIWKKYKSEIDEIQKGLLVLIHNDNETLKTITSCKLLLSSYKSNEPETTDEKVE